MSSRVRIVEVAQITDEICEAFERLIPQLTLSSPPPARDELAEVIAAPHSLLFVARDSDLADEIVGTLTLVLYRTPISLKGRIEDVVVDARVRRKGIGVALMRAALRRATRAGARSVSLVTGPSNEAANRLYQSVGFETRERRVYGYVLEG
jgi:ribosomal protein S18 acetylase RimI-like enzyme